MFIDYIDNNIFLKKLYPCDIEDPIIIGRLSLDLSNYCEIDFHVTLKPKIDIPKKGVWGEDYNIVVIKTKGKIIGSMLIDHWGGGNLGKIYIEKVNGNFYKLLIKNENFLFKLDVNGLIFQGIEAYYMDK